MTRPKLEYRHIVGTSHPTEGRKYATWCGKTTVWQKDTRPYCHQCVNILIKEHNINAMAINGIIDIMQKIQTKKDASE